MAEEESESIRQQQRQLWGKAAPGWGAVRAHGHSPTQPVSDQMVEMADLGHGDRVLDLACGAGDPTFSIAEAVGADGFVLGLDLSAEMLETAHVRARDGNVSNVEFRAIESELALTVPDESFDAAFCRFGLMFMPDPVSALAELARAVKPGGRVVTATWGPQERVPFISTEWEILGRHVELPERNPHAPGLFDLSTPDILSGIFAEAGLEDVEVTLMDIVAGDAPDPETYWQQRSQSSGLLVTALASLSDEQREVVRKDALRTYAALCPDGPIQLHGEALVTVGVKT